MTLHEQILQNATEQFAEHVITEHLRAGVFRHWSCGRPGSNVYRFNITTIPGRLIVTGDVGELIVERVYDMLPWCREAINSLKYFASKVPSSIKTREFSQDAVKRWANELLESGEAPAKFVGNLKDAVEYSDDWSESDAYNETAVIWGGCDPPDFNDWTPNFLWCVEAIRWFLGHHEESAITPR